MITKGLLRKWRACWFEQPGGVKRVDAILAGRPGLTPREVAALDHVSLDDRLWVVCRALAHRNEAAARTFAIDCAASVSHLAGRPEDQAEHARLVEDLRRIFALPPGEREDDLGRWSARWSAAREAAWAAARLAAAWYAAAWNAGDTATWHTASAYATAWNAARAATRDTELRKAIERALVALGPDADGWA